jgi:hypothetical protein
MNRRSFINYLAAAGTTTIIPGVNMHAFPAVKDVNTPQQAGNELDYHTLDHITFTRIKLSYPRLVGRNSSRGIHGYGPDLTVCTLHTQQGVRGIGQLRGSEEDAERVTKYYSGMIYMDDVDPLDNPSGLDKIMEECQYDYQHGYRQLKLKIGRGKQWMPLD